MSHYGTLSSQDETEFSWGTLDILSMESESLQTYLENNSKPSLKKRSPLASVACNSFRMQSIEVSTCYSFTYFERTKDLTGFSYQNPFTFAENAIFRA